MQKSNKDELIQGADNMLLSGVKHKQLIWTDRLLNAISTREHALTAEYDDK